MGLFIALNTLLLAWTLALWCSGRTRWPRTVAWGVRLGLLAILAGSLEGVMMVQHGAHTVGAPDGLAGLAFLNWSTASRRPPRPPLLRPARAPGHAPPRPPALARDAGPSPPR